MSRRLRSCAALLAVLLVTGCGADPEQARLCGRLIEAFEPPAAAVEDIAITRPSVPESPVRVAYRSLGPDGRLADHWIACRFAASGFGQGRFELVAVTTDRHGTLDAAALFWLKQWLEIYERTALDPGRAPAPAERIGPAPEDPYLPPLYLMQQTVNALALICVYALLAMSFTLVYGVIERINFAFGELYMVGAMAAAVWSAMLALAGLAGWPAALGLVLLVSLGTAAVQGWTMERLVFRPLRLSTGHAVLIAAIGLSITLQEAVRLLLGARDYWLPAEFGLSFVVARTTGFTVVASWKQVGLVALTVVVLCGLAALLRRSAFGRAYRACADDPGAAALMGVDVDRTVGGTFALGGALAGLAGFVLVEYYGVANFFMGFLAGFKALTAAIVGGIGSIPGALCGAAVIGLLENFWSGYLDASYRDVAVFAVLAAVLVFRPSGLFGRPPDGPGPGPLRR